MSWEWRIFWPLKDDIDILNLLGVGQRGRSPHEVRTDVYVKCTNDVGIKWRGSKILEIKVRLERQESGAEKWIKVLHLVGVAQCGGVVIDNLLLIDSS